MQNQAETPTVEIPVVPIEEQISQELIKHNVTEAIIADIKEKYMPLKLADLNDKETYVIIKDARKECKSLRVLAKKICEKGREDANAISKAWVAKEKDVTGRIGEVEDHLEAQEKAFEAEQEKIKAQRKRQQEEQLIRRQTQLTNMGALYSDGSFALGEVSFELSLIKECEEDIWVEQILPKFTSEYQKIEAERIEADRKKKEQEEELKRQQEEVERKQRELEQREADLKKAEEERQQREREDQDRRDKERKAKLELRTKGRCNDLIDMGMKFDFGYQSYLFEDVNVHTTEITIMNDDDWSALIEKIKPVIGQRKTEAEEKRQAEIEEQKKITARNALNKSRQQTLAQYDHLAPHPDALADMTDEEWNGMLDVVKDTHEKKQREKWEKEQEEKKKIEEAKRQQEMEQAKDKERWDDILEQLSKIEIHEMRSGQYRKKAAILREKLEEVKAL